MSTWISRAAALVATLSLAGCTDLPGMAPDRMAVAGGSVVIAGPQGYCVDTRGSRDAQRGAFVLLGSCASLSGRASAPRPPVMAVLTGAVSAGATGAGITGDESRLASYFRSHAGRAALSRSGRADSVTILETHGTKGALFIRLRDTSAFPGRPDTPESWRVLFDLNGRIVTLSVVGLPDKPIVARDAAALLRSFMARVRRESPIRPTAPAKT